MDKKWTHSLLAYLWKHKSLLIAFSMDFNLLNFIDSTPTGTKLSLRVEASFATQSNAADSTEGFMTLAPLININNGFNLWFLKDARH